MYTYRTELRVPDNHLLQISVPEFEAGEDVEVIVLQKNRTEAGLLALVQEAASDPLFLQDIREIEGAVQLT
jgi:hypothetical protein